MGPRPARALGWVPLGLILAAAPAAADFVATLKETLAGRSFTQGPDTPDPAAKAMFERLTRGDYTVPKLTQHPDLARLDRAVAERCPKTKSPSQLVADSTPFLLTGQLDAKVPPGARITPSNLGSTTLDLPSGRFLVYAMTLTGARIAPAPIVEARALELGQCRVSGDALSLADGTTTDATIAGQGLVVIGGEPVWVVVARLDTRVGLTLQPLNRRLKNYAVGDGWKFLSNK
jgi:hypothetical protein